MSIYEENKIPVLKEEEKSSGSLYEALHNQLSTGVDYEDSIIFLSDEISDHTLSDLIIRIRSLLQNRKDKSAPIN